MKILMIGPLPGPTGGVANFVKNITENMENVEIHRVGKRDIKTTTLKQLSIDISDIINFIIQQRFKNKDIVHIHTASYCSFYRSIVYFGIIALLNSLLNSDCKILVHIHGGEFERFYNRSIYKKLIRKVLLDCDAIGVTSSIWVPVIEKIISDDRKSDDRKNKKIFVIHNGFDDQKFQPRVIDESLIKSLNIKNGNKKIILSLGDLEQVKGHKYLIEAAEIIKKLREDILICIIGDGRLKNDIKQIIKDKNLENFVLLLGSKNHDDIPVWINACDILVLSSVMEGNPTVMFESLGCGKPFIGTKVGGIPEIINSEEYGLLVDPKNSEDLAKKILLGLKKDWDNKLIRSYSERFSWQNISKSLLEIYDDMMIII